MIRDMTTINPEEVQFIELIHESDKSIVWQVVARELTCVMKIHRGHTPVLPEEEEIRDPSQFLLERLAYERLDVKGLTERGIVPKYYGYRRRLKPALWGLYLSRFAYDPAPADALFLEYIPNISKFWITEIDDTEFIRLLRKIVTPPRIERLRKMFVEIHKAGVTHNDLCPRNLTICDNEDRVLWMDFDLAFVRPVDDAVPPSAGFWDGDGQEYWDGWFESERETVDCLFKDKVRYGSIYYDEADFMARKKLSRLALADHYGSIRNRQTHLGNAWDR